MTEYKKKYKNDKSIWREGYMDVCNKKKINNIVKNDEEYLE